MKRHSSNLERGGLTELQDLRGDAPRNQALGCLRFSSHLSTPYGSWSVDAPLSLGLAAFLPDKYVPCSARQDDVNDHGSRFLCAGVVIDIAHGGWGLMVRLGLRSSPTRLPNPLDPTYSFLSLQNPAAPLSRCVSLRTAHKTSAYIERRPGSGDL